MRRVVAMLSMMSCRSLPTYGDGLSPSDEAGYAAATRRISVAVHGPDDDGHPSTEKEVQPLGRHVRVIILRLRILLGSGTPWEPR